MKRPFSLLSLCLFVLGASAQSGQHNGRVAEHMNTLRVTGVDFREIPLFTERPRSASSDALWQEELTQAVVVRLDRSATAMLLGSRKDHISLALPTEVGTMTLDLERVDITTDDFQVTQASTGQAADVAVGLHYRGMIRGAAGSMAAISIFPDEVMGLMSDAEGQRVLGRLANDTEGDHVLYRDQDMRGTSGAICSTADVDMSDDQGAHGSEITDRTVKCVRYYWEVNYDIFQGKGSVANAANYVTGLFNQSAILYANDGISVVLSEVYVWDVASPYTSSSTGTQLDTFGATRTSFNGDLAHLLGYTGGGGVAYVNTICSSQSRYRMAYSDINSTFSNVPTYSWSVEVVTHEQGHNLGSSHTHACAWNGNNTAIDGCGPAAGYTEGTCAQGPIPTSTVGGTIMSYCHLTSSGIKFNNGFGPQPAALIVGRINAASCLVNCATTTCGAPTNLVAGSLTTTSASLAWTGASGAASYTLQWKASSGSTWTSVSGLTGTSYVLNGLSAGTSYQFQVLTVCSGASSGYATAVSFTTAAAPAATCNVPAGLASGPITNTSVVLSWGAVSGATSYTLQWKTTAGSTWTTVAGLTSTSYALNGLASGTAHQSQVSTVCSNGSSAYATVVSFTTTATSTCSVPSGLASGSITTTSASLSWGPVSGATSYTVQWKTTAGSTWTTVTGLTATSYVLTGLAASTAYQYQVRTNCASSSSAYSSAAFFTTTSPATCSDVYEPNGSRNSARVIPVNTSITGLLTTQYDQDWFKFANTASASNIRVSVTGSPANYKINLYRGSTMVGSSNAPGTADELIVYNTTNVSSSYTVRVSSVGGTYNTTLCYTLSVQIGSTSFMMEGGSPEGIAEEDNIEVEDELGFIFPNPANDQVTISLPASDLLTTVELYDISGRVVGMIDHPSTTATGNVVLYLSGQPAGVYLLRISRGADTKVHRLVIGH